MNLSQEDMRIKALIIGINNYIASDHLKYAVNDATSVKALLHDLYDKSDIILMTDDSEPRYTPLGNNILSNIKLISQTVDENDHIFFYFAGHGKDIDGEPVLLPSDYRDEIGVDAAIKIEDIKKEFERSRAKFKLLILDSCHSGAVKGREKSGRMSRPMFDALNEVPGGFAIVSACGLDQISFEDDKMEHGVFTSYLLEGMKGKADANNDKRVTVNELYDYITPQVKEWVFREHNTSQIPHIRSNFGGIYIVSRLPEEAIEQKDTFGTELFQGVGLENVTHQMSWVDYENYGAEPPIEERLKETVKNVLLILRKVYGISGLKDDSKEIRFDDGTVIRKIETNEHRNETKFNVIVHFDYNKETWSKIDSLMLELDDIKETWEKVEFLTYKKFDFAKIEQLCTAKNYEMTDLSLIEPKYITFLTDFFSNRLHEVSVIQYDKYSLISITPHSYSCLQEQFYTLINPKKISEMFSESVAD